MILQTEALDLQAKAFDEGSGFAKWKILKELEAMIELNGKQWQEVVKLIEGMDL